MRVSRTTKTAQWELLQNLVHITSRSVTPLERLNKCKTKSEANGEIYGKVIGLNLG